VKAKIVFKIKKNVFGKYTFCEYLKAKNKLCIYIKENSDLVCGMFYLTVELLHV
jgi:hypothetical protein